LLMLWLRKVLFYIFALIYLILCPLIIAHMLGFSVNPLTLHIVKTGLVYISTNPPDANVYVDGRLALQKTPTILRDLAPGEHFIRIEHSDYKDWERNIPIVAKKATVLANTLLIPEKWPIKKISGRPYRSIISAGQGTLVAANPALKDIDIFDTIQDTGKPLFSKNSVYANGDLVHLFHAPQSSFILLEASIQDKREFLWINLDENPPLIEDISNLFVDIPLNITWKNTDNENIFAFYPTGIYRINIKDKAIFLQEADRLPESLKRPYPYGPQEKFLINDNQDLITRPASIIHLLPKENFGGPQVYDIAKARPSTNMYFEERTGELFYLDYESGDLFSVLVLPYHPVLTIPIPDALRIEMRQQ